MPAYQDLFSDHAECYARSRPKYPPQLFEYLASLTAGHAAAWDAGTGNGQAAIGLAQHFERVIATDASESQIAQAFPHPRVGYRVASAGESGIDARSIDLVTVAQALHWFPLEAFYSEVRRIAKPAGIIAAWCYTLPRVDAAIDAMCDRFYRDVLGGYWPPDRTWIDQEYQTIPFTFQEIEPTPRYHCVADWTLAQYAAYLESWSAVQRFRKERSADPLRMVWRDLESAWATPEKRKPVRWPIFLRVGRVHS